MQMPGMAPQMGFNAPMAPLRVQPQQGLNLKAGQVLDGHVLNRTGNQMTLRLGNKVLQAESSLPLDVGAKVQLQVKGEGSQGTMNLQLLRAQSFSPMTQEDIMHTMTGLKLPATEENATFAKSMLSQGVSLTKENFTELKEAMAQLPRTLSTDMQSASFLKMSSLPVTPQNITTLSQFLTNHPLIGAQLFETQFEFRKLAGSTDRKMSREMLDLLGKVPGLLGEYVLDGKKNTKQKNTNVPRNMAQQVGIEGAGPGSAEEEDLDLLKLLTALRSRLEREAMDDGEEMVAAKMLALLSQVEDNMAAQQLINKATQQGEACYYYLQVPLRLDDRDLTAEIKIYYTTDYDGSRKVDEENATLDFTLTAEHLGALSFHVEIVHGIINIEAGVEREEIRAFVERYLPALMENFRKHSYAPGSSKCAIREEREVSPLPFVECGNLERVNLSC